MVAHKKANEQQQEKNTTNIKLTITTVLFYTYLRKATQPSQE